MTREGDEDGNSPRPRKVNVGEGVQLVTSSRESDDEANVAQPLKPMPEPASKPQSMQHGNQPDILLAVEKMLSKMDSLDWLKATLFEKLHTLPEDSIQEEIDQAIISHLAKQLDVRLQKQLKLQTNRAVSPPHSSGSSSSDSWETSSSEGEERPVRSRRHRYSPDRREGRNRSRSPGPHGYDPSYDRDWEGRVTNAPGQRRHSKRRSFFRDPDQPHWMSHRDRKRSPSFERYSDGTGQRRYHDRSRSPDPDRSRESGRSKTCKYCSKKCSSNQSLMRHVEKAHADNVLIFKCTRDCGYKTVDHKDLLDHMENCSRPFIGTGEANTGGETPTLLRCCSPKCSFSTFRMNDLQAHHAHCTFLRNLTPNDSAGYDASRVRPLPPGLPPPGGIGMPPVRAPPMMRPPGYPVYQMPPPGQPMMNPGMPRPRFGPPTQ